MESSPYDKNVMLFTGQHVTVSAVRPCPEAPVYYELTHPITGVIEPFEYPFDANLRASALELEAFRNQQQLKLF